MKNWIVGALIVVVGVSCASTLKDKTTKAIGKAVVTIYNPGLRGGGTGFIIERSVKRSKVLTNAHVCDILQPISLLSTEMNSTFLVAFYQKSKITDLCLITVLGDMGDNADFSRIQPKVGDKVTVMGHPRLAPLTTTKGEVTKAALMFMLTGAYSTLATDATVDFGSSGSPVFNESGYVVGIIFAMDMAQQGSFIPLAHIQYFLEEEVAGIEKRYMGESPKKEAGNDQEGKE